METDQRAQVWAKTNGHCWYCGVQTNPWTDFHVEHMLPRSQGGTDALANLVPSCRSCNLAKHSRTVEEFRVYLQTKAQHTFWFEHVGLPVAPGVEQAQAQEERAACDEPDLFTYMAYVSTCLDFTSVHPKLPLVMLSLLFYGIEWDLSDLDDERAMGFFCLSHQAERLYMPMHELLAHLLYLEEHHALVLFKSEHDPDRTEYEFRIGRLRDAKAQATVRHFELHKEGRVP